MVYALISSSLFLLVPMCCSHMLLTVDQLTPKPNTTSCPLPLPEMCQKSIGFLPCFPEEVGISLGNISHSWELEIRLCSWRAGCFGVLSSFPLLLTTNKLSGKVCHNWKVLLTWLAAFSYIECGYLIPHRERWVCPFLPSPAWNSECWLYKQASETKAPSERTHWEILVLLLALH